jgi:hypothetical protein
VEIIQRADRQLQGLARTLREVNGQIDAVLDDEDLTVTEVLVEEATGDEAEFRLAQSPVSAEGFVLAVNGSPVSTDVYDLDASQGVVTPSVAVPQGSTISAEYTVPGLASQCAELLALMPDLSATYFLSRRTAYGAATRWIEQQQQGE